jgi:hypothetical protein
MKEFEYQGTTTVAAGVLKAFLAAFGPYVKRGEQVLCKRFGVAELNYDEGSFYPLPQFLESMDEFQRQFGQEFLRKIGAAIFATAAFPPGIDSVEKGMGMLNQAYYMNHQTKPGEIGGYHWQTLGEKRGRMTCDNPYPCSFDLGIIETISKQFASTAKVIHEPGDCRHNAGGSCSYLVEW